MPHSTGPAYQPINNYLRQLASLSGSFQSELARHPRLTFAATVLHISDAIRKIAAVATADEVTEPLFRGVRGVLPKGFFDPDATGLVCATDTAFMSTSRRRYAPIMYMDGGDNVLWKLRSSQESDSGFHSGADVSMLSQYAAEEETLFPPYTRLDVSMRAIDAPDGNADMAGDIGVPWSAARSGATLPPVRRSTRAEPDLDVHRCEEPDAYGMIKHFLSIGCVPSFV